MLTPSAPGLEIMFPSVQGFHMLGQAVEPSLSHILLLPGLLFVYRNLEGELVLHGIWDIMQRNKGISGSNMSSCCTENTKSSVL